MAPKTYVEMMIIKELSKLENLSFWVRSRDMIYIIF
jgi:hypothetical protein